MQRAANKIPKHLITLGLTTLGFVLLFLKLAFWQFDRSDEKRQILDKIANLSDAELISIDNIPQLESTAEYNKIKLQGSFDYSHTIFLANQFHDHKYGFHVITPFILQKEPGQPVQAILVNRGWTKDPIDSVNQYKKHNVTEKKIISGVLKIPDKQYIMGENLSKLNNYIQIQNLDLDKLQQAELFPYPIAHKYLKLLSPTDQGYILDWHWTNMTPEKHYAYAIQWLLLAITVILLYSCLCYKSYKTQDKNW